MLPSRIAHCLQKLQKEETHLRCYLAEPSMVVELEVRGPASIPSDCISLL